MLEEQGAALQKMMERQDGIEKTVQRMGRSTGDANDVIRKALSDGRGGNAATANWDGADTLGLLRITGGAHQKHVPSQPPRRGQGAADDLDDGAGGGQRPSGPQR
jgi:hypothetical protein